MNHEQHEQQDTENTEMWQKWQHLASAWARSRAEAKAETEALHPSDKTQAQELPTITTRRTSTVRDLLDTLLEQNVHDGQDAATLLQHSPFLDLDVIVHVSLRNVNGMALTIRHRATLTKGLTVTEQITPVEGWPVVVLIQAYPCLSMEQMQAGDYVPDSAYQFCTRIPVNKPEAFNLLLRAFNERHIVYYVS